MYTAVKNNSLAIRELLEGDDSYGNRVYTGMLPSLRELFKIETKRFTNHKLIWNVLKTFFFFVKALFSLQFIF